MAVEKENVGKTLYEYHELLETKSKEQGPKAFTIPISLVLGQREFMYLLANSDNKTLMCINKLESNVINLNPTNN